MLIHSKISTSHGAFRIAKFEGIAYISTSYNSMIYLYPISMHSTPMLMKYFGTAFPDAGKFHRFLRRKLLTKLSFVRVVRLINAKLLKPF